MDGAVHNGGKQPASESMMDRATGCIMGALLGDAMGTVLEFS